MRGVCIRVKYWGGDAGLRLANALGVITHCTMGVMLFELLKSVRI